MTKELTILETQLVQRAYDGRWEKIAKIVDYDNAYSYSSESGNKVTFIPEKWITIAVYDALLEFV